MDYFETLARWQHLKEAIATLQAEERALREGLFHGTFPDPEEGVNSYTLPDGRILKGTYKINRTIIKDLYLQNWSKLRIPSHIGLELIRVKHELVLPVYRTLDEDTRKKVDTVLEIKPGLPTLEIVTPKQKAPNGS